MMQPPGEADGTNQNATPRPRAVLSPLDLRFLEDAPEYWDYFSNVTSLGLFCLENSGIFLNHVFGVWKQEL